MSSPRRRRGRRRARRAMLSALAGGGLTAAGLGAPLSAALAAETSEATTGTTGPAETTPAPAPPAPTTPEVGAAQGSGEPTTTTSTATGSSSTSTTPPPATTPPPTTPAPAAPEAPTVVVQRTQKRSDGQKSNPSTSKTGTQPTATQPPATKPAGANGEPQSTPAGAPNGVAPPPQLVAGQAGTLASLLAGSSVSAAALQFYRVPLFLLPIYQAAGIQYGVPWQILAAINEVETDYGNDLSVSTAGAVGWMQFMPETWLQYGVDALGAGYADPYNPVDAIFAAARYLHAAGASTNLNTAILAYNHSQEYVDSVLLRAKLIASYPQSIIATLTGLAEGSLPVAGAQLAPQSITTAADLTTGPANATAGAVPVSPAATSPAPSTPSAPAPAGTPASPAAPTAPAAPAAAAANAATVQPIADQQLVDLVGPAHASVIAVQDGRIVKLGHSHKLGNYLSLRDVYGDVFTYAGLGSIAPRYREPSLKDAPASKRASANGAAAGAAGAGATGVADTLQLPHDPTPKQPASAGHQPLTLHVKSHALSPAETESAPGEAAATVPGGLAGKVRLFAHPNNPLARAAAARGAAAPVSDAQRGSWLPLRLGSVVSQGVVLGHLGDTTAASGAQFGRLRFAIRPAGDRSSVDPRPILANWRELGAALHPKGAHSASLLGATAADVFLLSKSELERTVLADPGIDIYACGRQDIASGAIDSRVLAVLAFLSRSGLKPTVSALRCGHSEYTTSGNVSEHYTGDAVDISAINGTPIAGHQGPGSITDVTIRALLTLQGRFVPHQIISLMQYPGAPNTLALPEHWNHIHVGFRPVGALVPLTPSATASAAHSAGPGQTAPSPLAVAPGISSQQWTELVARIGSLPEPVVATKPSGAAIRDPQAAASNRDLGSSALPFSAGAEE